jgi:hypothetical protein
LPNSKKEKMIRFQTAPPNWGPKAKPKRKLNEGDEEEEISNVR